MELEKFVNSGAGLITAIAALVAAMAALVKAIGDYRKNRLKRANKDISKPSVIIILLKQTIFILGITSLFVSIGIFTAREFKTSEEEHCIKYAWDTFNKKDYEKAFSFSNDCIDNFGKAATKIQKELDSLKVPLPPTGTVSDAEKDQIFKRGLLNDVATACWIKGRSAEYLYRQGGTKKDEYKKMAEEAYKETCKYKHGRTWDPKGWFWSPCEAASNRLPLK